MIYYDEKIRKHNLKTCEGILEIHSRCMKFDDLRELRELYCQWCDAQLSEKAGTEVKYMEIVNNTRDMLHNLNEWSEDWKLRKTNENLYAIKPFTNLSIYLFSVVGESK